jgi:peptide/nickel transport system permease protein
VLLGSWLLLALAPSLWSSLNPYRQDDQAILANPGFASLLGTDNLGRDVLVRILAGAHASILLGVLAAAVATVIGLLVGLPAALGPQWLQRGLMLVTDAVLAVPVLILSLAIAILLGQTHVAIGTAVCVAIVPHIIRVVRAEIRSLDLEEFVQASRTLGTPTWRVTFMHLLPGLLRVLLVQASLRSATAIWVEAALGFLGAGPPPPTPSWGLMISEGKDFLLLQPWACIGPSVAVTSAALAFLLIADGMMSGANRRNYW